MNTREMQDEILHLKKEKGVCILAHAYQSQDIWEVADFVGDSFALSKYANTLPKHHKTQLSCVAFVSWQKLSRFYLLKKHLS